ncbi:MAG: DUF3426 domain-containing protein [Pseudomonadota bacterium]
MILVCENCAARFVVDPAAIGPSGRWVRCGRCRHEWRASPAIDIPAEAIDFAPPLFPRPLPPGSNLPALRHEPRGAMAAVLGWVLLIGLAAGLAGGYLWREEIVAEYPAVRPMYAAFGVDVSFPGEGLRIEDSPTLSRVIKEDVPTLVIEGRVANLSGGERLVPRLRAVLHDTAGRELYRWEFAAASVRLAPGESAPFRTEIRQPASAAAGLSINFADD